MLIVALVPLFASYMSTRTVWSAAILLCLLLTRHTDSEALVSNQWSFVTEITLFNIYLYFATRKQKHTHTHNCFTALWILFGTTRVSRYQKKHSSTHTYRGSSIVPYLLHLSTTIHGILRVQSTRLTVFFHNLSPCFIWSLGLAPFTSYSVHFFTNYCLLLWCSVCSLCM